MTYFHFRDRLAQLCGSTSLSPTANTPSHPTPSPMVDASTQLAQAASEIVFRRYPPLIIPPRHQPTPPPQATLIDLPQEILLKIATHVQDKPTLKALSEIKPLRQAALQADARQCTLDNLLHHKDAKNLSTFVCNLEMDPQLDIQHLISIRDWEFPSLQHLTIGYNINRVIKYSKMKLSVANDPKSEFTSSFSSQLFVTHPHLSKISTLDIKASTTLMDDFSGFQACKNLHTIHFSRTSPQISKQQLEQLSTLPLLETLSFDGTGSINPHNCVALPSLAHVKSLTLKGCFMFNPVIFEQIANMPELVNFSFNDAHENPGVEALKTLMENSPKLKRIECKRFWISHQNILELKDFASTHGIDLNIEQNSLYKPSQA